MLCFSESTCFGITYDPSTEMWSLKTSETKSEMASKHISYYKACVESKTVAGAGMYNKKSIKIVYILKTWNVFCFINMQF